MIFPAEQAKQIKAGDKTSHRLPVKRGEYVCRFQIGKDYAVQPGHGKKAICRMRIVAVTRDTLGAIDDEAARLEGFENFAQFLDYWEALYGDIDVDQPVWVVTFERKRRNMPRDTPLYLHKSVRGGVTTNPAMAVLTEPEVIPAEIVAALPATMIAQQRWLKDRTATQGYYADMTVTERVERALSEAKAQGVDTARYEAAIMARVRALENRIRRNAA